MIKLERGDRILVFTDIGVWEGIWEYSDIVGKPGVVILSDAFKVTDVSTVSSPGQYVAIETPGYICHINTLLVNYIRSV